MKTDEAIKYLLSRHVSFTVEDIEEHEEYAEEETGEYQILSYEDNLKDLDAYLAIFQALDPSIDSIETLKEKAKEAREELYGGEDPGETPSSEEEVELVNVLKEWEKTRTDIKKGFAWELALPEEYNQELAKINLETGENRHIIDEEDDIQASLDDTFAFYYYRGEVCVVYCDLSDGDFSSYSEEFQKKALELVKKAIEEGTAYNGCGPADDED